MNKSLQHGFSLIELLTIVALIGVLAKLSMSTFYLFKASAAYASSVVTLRNAIGAFEASSADADILPVAVPLTAQTIQGGIIDPLLSSLIPGMQLPRRTKLQAEHDPTCVVAACEQFFVRVDHCQANEYVTYSRYGDGAFVFVEKAPGATCS